MRNKTYYYKLSIINLRVLKCFFQFILWKPFSFKLYSTVASRSQQTGKKARQRRRSRLVKVPRHKRVHRKVVLLYLIVVSSLQKQA